MNKKPKVTLYCELYNSFNGFFFNKVGTGFITSYINQKKALTTQNIFFTEDLKIETDIFQANSHGPRTFWLAWRFKRRGKKIIFYAHSTVEDLQTGFRMIHFFVPLLRWYLSKLYNFADAVACPTSYTANLLNTKYSVPKNKTIVISNGVSIQNFYFDKNKRDEFRKNQGIFDNECLVINVAMAVSRKGTDTFSYLGKIFSTVKFIWYGKVFNVLFAPKLPKHTPNVKFQGYIDDIMKAYLSADIFLFPSYEEQQGISILEAGALGLPILVRDIPVYSWINDGSECLKAKTNEEFKEKLSILINEPLTRQRLGTALQDLVIQDHSLEAVGTKLNNLYTDLI